MVENSDMLVAYVIRGTGGAADGLRYAPKYMVKRLKIRYIGGRNVSSIAVIDDI